MELSYQGQAYGLTVTQVGAHSYRVDGDAPETEVEVDRLSEFESRLVIGDRRHHVVSVAGRAQYLVEVDGISHQISQDEAGVVRAPAPAVVVAVPVSVGDEVEVGATLVVLESMKMETAVRAPVAGRVREVLAMVNSQVDAGTALLRVEESSEESTAPKSPRVQFDLGAPPLRTGTPGPTPSSRSTHSPHCSPVTTSARSAPECSSPITRSCAPRSRATRISCRQSSLY